jgi:dTDP-3-amino-3,4,6-trideoxy-alpha-D-glucose transaminase
MSTPAATARVPFLDLGAIHNDLKDDLLESFSALIDSGAFINGPQVAEFEDAFAAYVGTAEAIGLASGLDALRLGLIAMGLERGDEVIVPANTFVATLEGVTQAGGVPVPVDMSETDWNIDVAAAEAAISDKTRCLLPVHLYGQMADMRALATLADRRDLSVLEDACQAHGATRDGFAAGTLGAASAFSFYPGKNLGAFGDAGALTTNDAALADAVRALREHGQRAKYEHEREGWTARLDTIQAIVLSAKLQRLDGWNEERRAIARHYVERLAGVGDLELPPVAADSEPVWHLFVVRTADPAALAEALKERGIATGRHYPDAVHLTEAYRGLGYERGSFPVAERHADRVLSLPIFPGMTIEAAEAVVAGVSAFFAGD